MVRAADRGHRCDDPGRDGGGIPCGQRPLAMTDQVDPLCTGPLKYSLDLRQELITACFVGVGRRQIGDEHPGACTAQGLLDVVEESEGADPVETEQAVNQQDGMESACIPLHVHTFSQEFVGVRGPHSKALGRSRDV